MIQSLGQFFFSGTEVWNEKIASPEELQKMMGWSFDSCFQWHSMVSAFFNIPMDGHSMNVRGKEASA